MVKPTPEEREKLVAVLSPEDRAKVEAGDINVFPAKPGSYPVLRWAKGNSEGKTPGSLAPGTGHAQGAGDIGNNAARYAYKRTNAYKDLLEHLIPADLDPTKRGSIGWLFEQGFAAAEGGTVSIDVTCPDCGHKHKVEAWKKPDAVAFKTLIEQVLGRATETKNVNVESKNLHAIIDERIPAEAIEVYDLDDEIVARRRAEIEGGDEGDSDEAVEGSWVYAE